MRRQVTALLMALTLPFALFACNGTLEMGSGSPGSIGLDPEPGAEDSVGILESEDVLLLSDGTVCYKRCVATRDLCEGKACAFGETCIGGDCIQGCYLNACDGVNCADGKFCEGGFCRTIDGCDKECGEGFACHQDCVNEDDQLCGGEVCGDCDSCIDNRCTYNPCACKTCEAGQYCKDGMCLETCIGCEWEGLPGCAPGLVCAYGRCIAPPVNDGGEDTGDDGTSDGTTPSPGSGSDDDGTSPDDGTGDEPTYGGGGGGGGQVKDDGCPENCLKPEICITVIGVCCEPICDGKACGEDDGCGRPCYSGDCPSGEYCKEGVCECQPDCDNKNCGADDGCGGVCPRGLCPPDEVCDRGVCVCAPNCDGKDCGADDGCGNPCMKGTCPGGEFCERGVCECLPDCTNKACGADDGCGGTCLRGDCPTGTMCEKGVCICAPDCTNVACGGDDGCGGTCLRGDCPTGKTCEKGVCVCEPSCTNVACGGDDGCGGTCLRGDCPTGQACEQGVCTCEPTCRDKACGADDGCGGKCLTGDCGTNEFCNSGVCVQDTSGSPCPCGQTLLGDTCVAICSSTEILCGCSDCCRPGEYCDASSGTCRGIL